MGAINLEGGRVLLNCSALLLSVLGGSLLPIAAEHGLAFCNLQRSGATSDVLALLFFFCGCLCGDAFSSLWLVSQTHASVWELLNGRSWVPVWSGCIHFSPERSSDFGYLN